MARSLSHFSSALPAGSRVLPLHGGRAYAPSSVLARARLGDELGAARIRAAVAYLAEVGDRARAAAEGEGRWWTEPVDVDGTLVAARACLPLEDAEQARDDLTAAGLLVPAERGVRMDADVLCECPALLRFNWEGACERLRDGATLVAPTLALLREVVRLADAGGVVRTTLPRLQDAVLYGRTRLTQSLARLESAAFVERRDLPNRTVQLQLRQGAASPPPPVSRPPFAAPPRAGRMRLPTQAPIQIGGETLELLPGVVPELEMAEDGQFYLWIGPVRLGPYAP